MNHKHKLGRIILVVLFTLAGIIGGNIPLRIYLQRQLRIGNSAVVAQVTRTGDLQSLNLPQGLEFFFLFFPFILALAGLILGYRIFFGGTVKALIRKEGSLRWPLMIQGGILWLIPALLADGIMLLVFPGSYRWDFQLINWIRMNFWLILFIPLQTALEEFFFRGFMMDILGGWGKRDNKGQWSRSSWSLIALFLPAILFTLLHLPNPEMELYGYLTMLPQYLGMALFLGWLSYRDRGLERAWGIHLVNNWYVIALVNLEGSSVPSYSLLTQVHYRPWLGFMSLILSMVFFITAQFLIEKRQPQKF